jgi:hypothetical protein
MFSEHAVDVELVDNNNLDKQTGSDNTKAVQECEQGQLSSARTSLGQTVTVITWINKRQTGVFVRTFYLPSVVGTSGIKARLSQGLLKVMVPKRNESVLISKNNDVAIETTGY